MISKDRLSDHLYRIEAVSKWPALKSVTKVQSFLGLVAYYRKFIEGFGKLVVPLAAFTRKGNKYERIEKCKENFQEL